MMRALVLCILSVFLLANIARGQTLSDPKLRYRVIGSVIGNEDELATAMAFIGPDDLLVLRKNSGQVVRVLNGVGSAPVLDLHVNHFSGRGLLGIALHPNFTANGFVYLYYTKSSINADVATNDSLLDNRVERYTWNGSQLVDPMLIVTLPTEGVHVGGTLAFGPDGKLYVSMGFNDRSGKLQNNNSGADPDDTGVILRLNDDGGIPTDNPFFAQGGNLRKYFAYGMRNSFGLAFDPYTGRLWNTDNGDEFYDEINLVLPGLNSGWQQIMGPEARTPGALSNLYVVPGSHYADPKFSWLDPIAPTGLVFMTSSRLGAQYRKGLFVAQYNSGRIYRFKLNDARDGFVFQNPALADLVADDEAEQSEILFATGTGLLTDLKIGPDGKLYVLRLDGNIVVIERAQPLNCGVDFDGDCASDISIYRDGLWAERRSSDSTIDIVNLGGASDIPVPADYDGDSITDEAVYSNGTWTILRSSDGATTMVNHGGPSFSPVPGDYDGDGKADIAVYSGGVWSIRRSSDGVIQIVAHGGPGWTPVPADYDGDGKTDVAVYINGAWSIRRSSDNVISVVGHGGPSWQPVPADYDGDGKADVAVYTNGAWSILRSGDSGNTVVGHGGPTWVPVPADYDGDEKADIAVYNASGAWSIKQSSNNAINVVGHGGGPNDVPLK